jgi:hypothetical protein
VHGTAPAHDGEVTPWAHDSCAADRERLGGNDIALHRPQFLVLQIGHRVATRERGLQQIVVILWRGGRNHHQAGNVCKPALERLRMLRGRRRPDPDRHPQHDRHPPLAAEHVAILGGLVDDFIHSAEREIDHPQFDHWPHAGERHADRRTHDRGLRDRRIDDARGAKPGLQPAVLAEDSAPADVFTHRNHRRVCLHGSAQRIDRCLRVCAHSHCPAPVL